MYYLFNLFFVLVVVFTKPPSQPGSSYPLPPAHPHSNHQDPPRPGGRSRSRSRNNTKKHNMI